MSVALVTEIEETGEDIERVLWDHTPIKMIKENFQTWERKIKSNLSFRGIWDLICETRCVF